MIQVTDDIAISDDEITYKFSRSAGPGGQNVNKLNTHVTLFFNLAASPAFTDTQKKRLSTKLSRRISKDGLLKVVSQRHRTQRANRRAAQERLAELLSDALKEKPVRKQTRVPYTAKQKRLRKKRRRSELKSQRKSVPLDNSD